MIIKTEETRCPGGLAPGAKEYTMKAESLGQIQPWTIVLWLTSFPSQSILPVTFSYKTKLKVLNTFKK